MDQNGIGDMIVEIEEDPDNPKKNLVSLFSIGHNSNGDRNLL